MRPSSLLHLVLLAEVLAFSTGCGYTCNVAPSITGMTADTTVNLGRPVIFTVAASGSNPLAYQWLRNGAPVEGATGPSFSIKSASATDSGSAFSVRISNPFGAAASTEVHLTVAGAAASNVRFVAPNGNDANPGTIDRPYQTIQACARSVGSGWSCEVRAGTYRETVTPNSGITVEAYQMESVTVDGSDPVTGWTRHKGSIYKATVALRNDDTNQLFVGNRMMTEARWPNGTDLFHVKWATAQAGTNTHAVNDTRLPNVDWTGTKIHLWSGSDAYGHQTGVVTASRPGSITIDVGQNNSCPQICPAEGGFYYLFGSMNALDSEEEWYYDAASSVLYFIAPGRGNPAKIEVRAKQRDYAFDLRGRSDVTIRNIGIFSGTIVTDSKSSGNVLDRITAQYVSHFTSLATNESGGNYSGGFAFSIIHVADSGIILNGAQNTIENSTISYSAGAGIASGGEGNIIQNNLIENVDYVGDYASGIDLMGSGNTIRYNTIHDVGRIGIFVFNALSQDIGYNNLYHAMLFSHDGGEIYTCCLLNASGTRIHHNWIHDTTEVVRGPGDITALAGVYIDNGDSGFEVDQNVLWNNRLYNINVNGLWNTGPNSNFVHHNTVPDRSSDGMISIMNVANCAPLRVSDNQVVIKPRDTVYDNGCLLTDNNDRAPGATEMNEGVSVGCNFAGCSTFSPPGIVSGGSVTPCPVQPNLQQMACARPFFPHQGSACGNLFQSVCSFGSALWTGHAFVEAAQEGAWMHGF
jgi:hypothetical protein